MSRGARFRFEAAPDLPGSDRLSKYALGAINATVRRLWDVQAEGVENVPLEGPALICPNHLSFCDSVFVPAVLPRRTWAIGKGEYMDDWKTKHLFPALGMIPVDRSGGKAAMDALDTAARVLDGGHLFMIYPEGTRSRDGNLHKGRTGAARLAIRCNAPLIPVGHQGTLEIQPPGQFTMTPFKTCTVKFGEPIWPADHGDLDNPRLARIVTDALMYEIAELSGQTYVHTYAGEKKQAVEEAGTRPTAPSQATEVRPTRPPGRPAGNGSHPEVSDAPARPVKPSRPTRPGATATASATQVITLADDAPTATS